MPDEIHFDADELKDLQAIHQTLKKKAKAKPGEGKKPAPGKAKQPARPTNDRKPRRPATD